ncbi:MAG: hypothetical protein IE887_09830 [Campylobacterales bacterium]|nr:hypothetical protein [Campylobacterales bacterium]
MKLKLARTSLKSKPKAVEIEEIAEQMPDKSIFYFDKENSHKDIIDMVNYFEEKGHNVYMREVKYGLNEDEYIYEVHII